MVFSKDSLLAKAREVVTYVSTSGSRAGGRESDWSLGVVEPRRIFQFVLKMGAE